MPVNNKPLLVAHVVQRLAVGGLENGLVNLINHMPRDRYHHAIVCLTDATAYAQKIQREDVQVIVLHQRGGKDIRVHGRFLKVLRRLRPDIVHTRNLPALEFQVVAAFAGIRARVHGEHGRDVYDLDGTNIKYNLLRKTIRPLIHRYIAVSGDLAGWLVKTVGVQRKRVAQICNGVDTVRFRPRAGPSCLSTPPGFISPGSFVLGTVGRMEPVKDQLNLVRAFLHLLKNVPGAREHARLVMVGEGRLREEARRLLHDAGAESVSWLPGERSDVPELMRVLDLFVLPSIREGISNTILEAMATGLPVVATKVGGNPELLNEGETGMLVSPSNPIAMAEAIRVYIQDRAKAVRHGQAGRRRVESCFSMKTMVSGYLNVYDSLIFGKARAEETADRKTAMHNGN